MRFQLLGPVTVVAEGNPHYIPRAQTRGTLALLLLHADRMITREGVIDALWGGAAPSTARAQLHNAVRDIRRYLAPLGGDRILVTERLGYRAAVDPGDVDALAFERQVSTAGEARRGGDHQEACRLLHGALDMWSGDPLLDAAGAFAEPTRARLVDLRLTAIEDLADLELRHGRPELVAADLAPLVHEFPWRERLRVRLMTALYRSGRRTDALRCARDYRLLLADREGLDPGREILDAEAGIRRSEAVPAPPVEPPTGAESAPARPAATAGADRPAQLPADPVGFVARDAESAALDGLRLAAGPGTSRMAAIVGPGGSGKTALAVHWAHRNLTAFEDGQLYIDLHGFGLDRSVDPFDALGRLLRGLGRPNDTLPPTLDERSTMWRSLMSARRMLVLLDNAGSSTQVRPLLPGTGPHVTLITSRRRLDGLSVGEGVRQFQLDPMPPGDATRLLREHIDTGRVDGRVLAELVRIGAGLPLALRIVAARLAGAPGEAVGDLVTDLVDERRRLAALSLPSEDMAVRSAFATTYHSLSGPARGAFRVLGLLPTPDTSLPAWAAAADLPVDELAAHVDELHGCHLVQRMSTDRCQVHDLVRLYARDLAVREEPAERRHAAERRLAEWYVQAANRADAVIRPYRGDLFPAVATRVGVPEPADTTAALAWFDREADNLLVALERAAELHPTACWQLAAVLFGWLERHQRRTAWLSAYETGARAAAATGDREALALMRQTMAVFHCHLEQFDRAAEMFTEVLTVRRAIGQRRGIATTLMNLGNLYAELGRDADAIPRLTEAREMFEAEPDSRSHLGMAYDNLGWAHRKARRYAEAAQCFTKAAEIARECDDTQSVGYAESNLATVYADCGRHAEAEAHWLTAIEHARLAGDLKLEAAALTGRGRTQLELGDYAAARRALAAAAGIYRTTDNQGKSAELAELLASVPAG